MDASIMKNHWMTSLLVVLALWVGYTLGYRQGARNEERAWVATAPLKDMNDEPRLYKNPHTVLIAVSEPDQDTVNRPDPRTCEPYERSLP